MRPNSLTPPHIFIYGRRTKEQAKSDSKQNNTQHNSTTLYLVQSQAKQAKGKEEKLHSAMIPSRQHPTMTSSARMSIIVALMTALLPSLSFVSSFGTQTHSSSINFNRRTRTTHDITTHLSTTHWPFSKSASASTTRLFAAQYNSKSDSFQRKLRISASNHQASMRWVVESIEKVLKEETHRGTGRKNSPEDDEALMNALNNMQRGAFAYLYFHSFMHFAYMHYCTLLSISISYYSTTSTSVHLFSLTFIHINLFFVLCACD